MMRGGDGAAASPTRTLRVWAPQGAQVLFVRQVAPTIEDLTDRAVAGRRRSSASTRPARGATSPATTTSPCGCPPKPLGAEQLAARVQLVVGDEVVGQGLVKATWSDDTTLTTRINPAVAHYTGQAELAAAIQEGLAAKAAGDDATATLKLGRAAQARGGDRQRRGDEPAEEGRRHRGRRHRHRAAQEAKVSKLDEMALDTASTKTTRVR